MAARVRLKLLRRHRLTLLVSLSARMELHIQFSFEATQRAPNHKAYCDPLKIIMNTVTLNSCNLDFYPPPPASFCGGAVHWHDVTD